jgi:hypothetical protein
MRVAELQKFIANQAELLTQAGAKSVAADFARFAAGLAPFVELSVAQLADFLARAEDYARTGVLPTTGKAPRKKTPALDSGEKIRAAAQQVTALYERALDPSLAYAAIDQQIQSVGKSLTKDEAVQVAREFGILQALKTKKDALAQMVRKISERKESHERIQFREKAGAS